MKKTTKSLKPKESVTFEPRLASSRSEPSLVRPSLHPWYYVKGRKDLTEKNISSRREREEQRHRQYVSNSQYFDKRMAETQVFDKWNDNQSLVRHTKQLPILSLNPPYDTTEPKPIPGLDIRLNKEFQIKYSKAKQKLTEFMHKFKELDKNEIKLEKRQNVFVFQIKELRKIQISVEEKKQFYEFSSKQLSQNRFNRNKLRKKVFQIIEILSYYRISIKKIQVLKDCDGVLTEEEMIQLTEVIERGLKILEMYIELNHNRNNEFQIMFDEEAENRWETQDIEWQTEYQVWSLMIDKLISSFINVVKEKLSQLLAEETNALEQRQQLLKELTQFSLKTKSDSQLSQLLTQNMDDFLKEVEEKHKNNS